MSLKRSKSTAAYIDNLFNQSSSEEEMNDGNQQITSNSNPNATPSWNPAALNADNMYEYCSVAVTDPRLRTDDRLKIFQAMQLSRAAQQANITNNAFVNSQLAAATGTSLYGRNYGRWIEASYQGNQLGLPAPPPPNMTHSTSRPRTRPKGRGQAQKK